MEDDSACVRYDVDQLALGAAKLNTALIIVAAVILGDDDWFSPPNGLWEFARLLHVALGHLTTAGVSIQD